MLSVGPLTLAPLACSSHSVQQPPPPSVFEWQFDNGSVKIPEPLSFGNKMLRQPRLLGSGGGGAVFALTQNEDRTAYAAVKISWASSAESIANECRVLQLLEQQHVTGIEHCLGIQPYREDARRVMILLEPVMEGPTAASLSELPLELERHDIEMLLNTMFQIVSANVAVTDVQILISLVTGDVLLIDFSEAHVLSSVGPLSFMEQVLLSNFIQEVSALIPENQMEYAAGIVSRCLEEYKSRGVLLRDETLVLLEDQFSSR